VIYTENYPPYNFLNEEGEIVGSATEKVRQVMDATSLDYTIKLIPWARAMHHVANDDNALIYTLTRTPDRDLNFDWLVPLAPSNFYLFTRADETRSVTLQTLRAGMFRAVCVSKVLGCNMLRWTGMPNENIVTIYGNETADFKMVIAGRADIYVSDVAVNELKRKAEGFNPAMTKPVMRIEGKIGFYLASGLKVPDVVRARIVNTHKTLVQKGEYQMIETHVAPNH
jgi:polar amino acid transport system substrate-binding protein